MLIELEKVSALRKNRMRVAKLVLEDPTNLKALINIVFDVDNQVSLKAAWVLEFVVKENVDFITPFLDVFVSNMKRVHFGGAVRSTAKITQLITEQNNKKQFITSKQKEILIEVAFDWIISNHKVAIKAYSMRILFLLGKTENWVHDELKMIIVKNIINESAAYKARGRTTLKQIEKWKRM